MEKKREFALRIERETSYGRVADLGRDSDPDPTLKKKRTKNTRIGNSSVQGVPVACLGLWSAGPVADTPLVCHQGFGQFRTFLLKKNYILNPRPNLS